MQCPLKQVSIRVYDSPVADPEGSLKPMVQRTCVFREVPLEDVLDTPASNTYLNLTKTELK